MKIKDLYSKLISDLSSGIALERIIKENKEYQYFYERAIELQLDFQKMEVWMKSERYKSKTSECLEFIKELPNLIREIEGFLGQELPGIVTVGPSLQRIDGFARYDLGSHNVLFGPDHPRCDRIYRRILLAHELSHVYRDLQPAVWHRLGKSLKKVTRSEYLNSFSLKEHLASEGLAVLFSKVVFGGHPERYYTFHTDAEYAWCLENVDMIGNAVRNCNPMKSNDVWALYNKNSVVSGSAPWPHYFWSAMQLNKALTMQMQNGKRNYHELLLEFHALPAEAVVKSFF